MELERTVRDRIVNVRFKVVCGNDVIDLVVRHCARVQVVKAGEDRKHKDDDDQQFFDRQP